MSKQSEAKEKQRYSPNPILAICDNCHHMTSEMLLPAWMVKANAESQAKIDEMKAIGTEARLYRVTFYGDEEKREKNLRCDLGGFAVKKMGSCVDFANKEVSNG